MRGAEALGAIKFRFLNDPTKKFFYAETRSQCLSGGFGSGKTYVAIFKLLTLLVHFPHSRAAICRLEYKTLLSTTYKTFTKICPPGLIQSFDTQKGFMKLTNGSEILWMHLDDADEQTLKGLEINWCYIDQPEEISEEIYTLMDARIGRWDMAYPSPDLCNPAEFEKDPITGRFKIPSYMFLTPNPDAETHWIWRDFHPDSPLQKSSFTHSYFEVSSTENPTLLPENIQAMLSRDEAWVKRYVYGQWGISGASIHRLLPMSLLDYNKSFVDRIIREGNLYRILDHGDAAPTCVTWWSAWKGYHICYREYYAPGKLISAHRRKIHELSGDEQYSGDFADPAIFKQQSQANGGFWCIANEYLEEIIDEDDNGNSVEIPVIAWAPADNNEMATRNTANELLALSPDVKHPITGTPLSSSIYFIKASQLYPYGVIELPKQIGAARREKLGEINGRPLYSDEREKSVEDHAYDTFRYYISMRLTAPKETRRHAAENSFEGARRRMKMQKILNREGKFDRFGMKRPKA